ncbi:MULTISPECIES: type-F conjugative transfer system pilin assembly thiol-disulfide isomerase TrbB [Pantoea]|uniref:type-F conjugative transfer system pilin assembly thiol-disulfide isomerase TrbB n=1 Tax=Pantoea TaxID=53335 RepID=UPI001CC21B8B|nr:MULTISPECIES: type-F conjugative transfer system pilin assembly thiol-disulfide isomerase TrbB [Pantoea]
MKYVRRIACYGLLSALPVHFSFASTLDEIRALESKKEMSAQQDQQNAVAPRLHSSARQYSLPDNRQINVDDYRIVLFMQGGCHYCQQFDPQLAQLSSRTGFKVFPYTLDGRGDVSFPDAIPAPRAVLDQFFGPGNNGVTPTTFLVNVNTLQSWPLAQGIVDVNSLLQRIQQALETGG